MSNSLDRSNGGAAFPMTVTLNKDGHPIQPIQNGMTLRDYFAAKAIRGRYVGTQAHMELDCEAIAKEAYAVADAMLKERAK